MEDVEVGLMPFIKINNQFVLDEELAKHSLIAKHWIEENLENTRKFQMYMEFQKDQGA